MVAMVKLGFSFSRKSHAARSANVLLAIIQSQSAFPAIFAAKCKLTSVTVGGILQCLFVR